MFFGEVLSEAFIVQYLVKIRMISGERIDEVYLSYFEIMFSN